MKYFGLIYTVISVNYKHFDYIYANVSVNLAKKFLLKDWTLIY